MPNRANRKEALCDNPEVYYGSYLTDTGVLKKKEELPNCRTCGHTKKKSAYCITIARHIQVTSTHGASMESQNSCTHPILSPLRCAVRVAEPVVAQRPARGPAALVQELQAPRSWEGADGRRGLARLRAPLWRLRGGQRLPQRGADAVRRRSQRGHAQGQLHVHHLGAGRQPAAGEAPSAQQHAADRDHPRPQDTARHQRPAAAGGRRAQPPLHQRRGRGDRGRRHLQRQGHAPHHHRGLQGSPEAHHDAAGARHIGLPSVPPAGTTPHLQTAVDA